MNLKLFPYRTKTRFFLFRKWLIFHYRLKEMRQTPICSMDESSIWEFYVAEIQLRVSTACYLNSKAIWHVSAILTPLTLGCYRIFLDFLSYFSLPKLPCLCYVVVVLFFFGICIFSIYFILQAICIKLQIWSYYS